MFRSLNSNNKQLIDQLRKQGTIKSNKVYETLLAIDRKYYVPQPPYYNDNPSSIGYGATISAPHMHAFALQYLQKNIITAKNILDVGSGTGILTAAMAIMAPENAKVYGIQHVPELVEKSIVNIKNSNPQLLNEKVQIKVGDGRKGWHEQDIKFDVIHVGAAPDKIPQKLLEQLNEGGVMVIPVGGEHETQKFLRIQKNDGQIQTKNVLSVRYVPLTDLQYQLNT